MKTNGETHSHQEKVEKILRSLTPRFELVATIEEANDISTITVRLLSGSLRAHEQRMNVNKIGKPIEQALQAQASIGSSYHKHGSSRGKGRGHGGSYSSKGRGDQNHGDAKQNNIGSNHNPSSNNSWRGGRDHEGRGSMGNKSNVECYNCHKRDHYANECRSKDLDDSFRTIVKFGDGRFVPVTGKGRILMKLKSGDHRYIYDIFHVPDMKSNLLSMRQLAEKGYVMHIVENQFSIFD
ncbi:uncharacterized protein [Phaseolus vulgaris]|uniref:uncharacterized protein n=1 Tax=Phaseolus vulgaris TaxID=3885 RepID=UPI0035CC4498